MNRFASAGALAIGLMVAGCTTPPPGGDGPDAGDAMGPGEARLSVDFDSKTPIPGDAGGPWDAVMTSAHMDLSDLRATGDSGTASLAKVSLDWNAELEPPPRALDNTRPGIYALLAASVDGYGVRGTIVVDGEAVEFEIVDVLGAMLPMAKSMDGLEVAAGDDAIFPVELDLRQLIDAVSWNNVTPDGDGVLRVDENSTQIDSVRDELEDLLGDDD